MSKAKLKDSLKQTPQTKRFFRKLLFSTFEKHFMERGYPQNFTSNTLSEVKFQERTQALLQRNKTKNRNTILPSSSKSQEILTRKWFLIQHSGGSREEASLVLEKKNKITKKRRRKKSRQGKRYSQINFVSTSKKPGPPLAQGLDPPLQQQPLLNQIFKGPPIISYKKTYS